MNTNAKLALVFVASVGLSVFLPTTELLKGIAAFPAVSALIAVVFQIVRDNIAHSRAEQLRIETEIFNLGITSHMANVAFDKQVLFCERYMEEVHCAMETLFREGPTHKVSEHAMNIAKIHRENAAWVPTSMALKLQPFEKAILQIASKDGLIAAWRGSEEKREERSKVIDEMYDTFSDVVGIPRTNGQKNISSEVAVETVKQRIRSILGVEQLTEIRQRLLDRASGSMSAGA